MAETGVVECGVGVASTVVGIEEAVTEGVVIEAWRECDEVLPRGESEASELGVGRDKELASRVWARGTDLSERGGVALRGASKGLLGAGSGLLGAGAGAGAGAGTGAAC